MTNQKKNGWIKFVPSLDLPKERVSIAYDTHDERGYRFAYGYFQFNNGTCSCFWKDGNEQPKVVKVEDIKYWMPVPPFEVQEEPISDDLEEAFRQSFEKVKEETQCVYDYHAGFVDGAKCQKQQMMKYAYDGAFIRRNRYTKKNVLNGFDTTCDVIQSFKDKDNIKVLFIKEG